MSFFPFFKLTVCFLQKECLFFFCFCDYEEKYIDTFFKSREKNRRVIDAFRSRLSENLPFGSAATSASLKAQNSRKKKGNYSWVFLLPLQCEQTCVF